MKFNLAVLFLLATLCVAVFATPVPEASEVERQRLRKIKRNTKALRKLNKRGGNGGNGGAGKGAGKGAGNGGAGTGGAGTGGAGTGGAAAGGAAAAGAAVATDPNVFNQDTLSGTADPNICNKSKIPLKGNGTQDKTPGPGGRTCVTTQLGEIPDVTNMPSTLIVSPQNGAVIPANKPFNIAVKITGIETGNFDNPDNQYYSFAQQLNREGQIKGHSHVTIQSLNGNSPPNPQVFDFFKGLNNPAQNGILSVAVTAGLSTKGQKRLCTMSSSFAHTPVIMPVAQRGSQDDCIRFTVV